MATVTLPSTPKPRHAQVFRGTLAAVSESPFSSVEQVYDWGVDRWWIIFDYPPMKVADAGAWAKFFYDVRGRVNTFAVNLNTYAPTISPAPGSVTFRLVDPRQSWSIDVARIYGFTLHAAQVIT